MTRARFQQLADATTASGASVREVALRAVETSEILTFEFPCKIVSEANSRDHWRVKNARKKEQQLETAVEWKRAIGNRRVTLPCTIRLTRIGCRKLDDDNLANGCKGIRDAIAQLIGVDDGSDLLRFEYAQEVIAKRQYAVRVEVMSR